MSGQQHPHSMVQSYQQNAARNNQLQASSQLRGDVSSQRQSTHQVMHSTQATLQSSPQMQSHSFMNVGPQQTATS